MVNIVVELETNALAYAWEQVIVHVSKLYGALDSYCSPARNTTLNVNPLQIKVASLEKQVNELKMNERGASTTTRYGPLKCFACGKKGVRSEHDGFPSSRSLYHMSK